MSFRDIQDKFPIHICDYPNSSVLDINTRVFYGLVGKKIGYFTFDLSLGENSIPGEPDQANGKQ
jgi:hypothetical protein